MVSFLFFFVPLPLHLRAGVVSSAAGKTAGIAVLQEMRGNGQEVKQKFVVLRLYSYLCKPM